MLRVVEEKDWVYENWLMSYRRIIRYRLIKVAKLKEVYCFIDTFYIFNGTNYYNYISRRSNYLTWYVQVAFFWPKMCSVVRPNNPLFEQKTQHNYTSPYLGNKERVTRAVSNFVLKQNNEYSLKIKLITTLKWNPSAVRI